MCFGKISDEGEYENHAPEEKLLTSKCAVSIFEYELDKFAVCVCNSADFVIMFDRSTK